MFSWLWGNTQQADCTLEVKIASDTTQLASVSQMHKHVLCSHFKVIIYDLAVPMGLGRGLAFFFLASDPGLIHLNLKPYVPY